MSLLGCRPQCGPKLPAPLEHDGEPDRELEQNDQRNHLERGRDRVDAGQCDREGRHRGVADLAVAPELRGREDLEANEGEHEDRQLVDEADRDQREQRERVIAARADLDVVAALVVVREEVHRRRQRDLVRERDADREEGGREDHEPADRALRVLVDRRGQKCPELPEDDRQREREAGIETHLERGRERLRDAERDRVPAPRRERLVQPVDQLVVEAVGHRKATRQGERDDDEPAAELAEVLDELRRLAWLQALRQPHQAAFFFSTGSRCSKLTGSAIAADASSSCLSWLFVTESLNSRKPFPSERPISGSRLGPQISSTTTPSKRISGKPMNPGMRLLRFGWKWVPGRPLWPPRGERRASRR